MSTEKEKEHIPQAKQPPRIASSASSEARQELENEGNPQGAAVFTKGDNAPTFNQTGLPYTQTDMNRQQHEPDGGADQPGGDGATPLSRERGNFLKDVMRTGHFADQVEAVLWTKAFFNVLREYALPHNVELRSELSQLVREGESPDVQLQEMLWGGDFVDRFARMLNAMQAPSRQVFLRGMATAANTSADDPWVEDALYAILSAIKERSDAVDSNGLGDLQTIWERTA